MSYTIERPSPCRVVVTATLLADEVGKEHTHVVNDWVRHARIDGFRKGKSPRHLVEKRYAKEIRDDVEEHIAREIWNEVRSKEKFHPASPFGIKDVQWKDDGCFSLTGELEVYPEVVIPGVEDFTPPVFDINPSDDEVSDAVEKLRERQAAWEPVEGEPVGDEMLVEAEVFGEYPDGDGESFHQERTLFQLGGGEVFPEIEKAVVGRLVGEEATTERIIGEEGDEERKGKRIAYRILVKSLRRKRLPEINDELATSIGAEGGLLGMRKGLAERIRLQKIKQRREVWRDGLVKHLAGDQVVELPPSVVEEETRKDMIDFARALAERGVDPEKAQVDWAKLQPEMQLRVEGRLRAQVFLDALADALTIEVTSADVDRELQHQARHMGIPFAELKGNITKSGGLGRVGGILRREKVLDQVFGRFVEQSAQ